MVKIGVLISCLLISSLASAWEVYGYIPGADGPQPLSRAQVNATKRSTHGSVATWLAIVSELNTATPRLHIIDQDHFDAVPSKYGTHQAYAQFAGLTVSDSDYIKRIKAEGRPRYLMPFTLYILADGRWVLQNRRYVFKDNSKNFAASLAKSEQVFAASLEGLVHGNATFITYEKPNSHYRPNTQSPQGLGDIKALAALGFDVMTEEEL